MQQGKIENFDDLIREIYVILDAFVDMVSVGEFTVEKQHARHLHRISLLSSYLYQLSLGHTLDSEKCTRLLDMRTLSRMVDTAMGEKV